MSALQRAIAELHRWKIPEGFTFVRSHRRGDVEKAVVYRSRSALRALYEIEDVADHTVRDDWFGFEARVRGLLRDRGLVPEQIELLGDEGISIFATVESGDTEGMWLIHALRDPRLGPSKVDRIAALLARAPAGTRGLLVTSGVATDSARARSQSTSIVLGQIV